MLSVEQCKKYLHGKDLTEESVIIIRDYIYALCEEVVLRRVEEYEQKEKVELPPGLTEGADS
jgi:hypothetical protein